MNKKWLWLKIISALVFFCFFINIFFSFVPFNMDEFVSYHVIACNEYPLNKMNVFRERCDACDLAIVKGAYLPLLSYSYIGSISAVLYYPLFKAWKSPYSDRLLGLIFLALEAFLLYRIFHLNIFFCFFFLLIFFSYAFQSVVFPGPKIGQTTSVFLIFYLSQRWRAALEAGGAKSWIYPSLIGFLIFLGMWAKLSYLLILPSIGLLVGYSLFEQKWARVFQDRQFKRGCLLLALAAAVPTYVLLNSVNRWGAKYGGISKEGKFVQLFDLTGLGNHLGELSKYFTNALQSAHCVFDIEKTITWPSMAFLALILFFLCFGVWRMASGGKRVVFVLLNVFLFFLAFLLMGYNQNVWAMHHVVMAFPFLLLALFDIISQCGKEKVTKIFLILFFCFNLFFYYALTQEKPLTNCYPGLVRLNEELNKKGYSHDYVFVVVDWGMYYLKSLYGNRDQCVLYIDPFPGDSLEELKKVLAETGRKPMFIGRKDVFYSRRIGEYFKEMKLDFDVGPWVVWY